MTEYQAIIEARLPVVTPALAMQSCMKESGSSRIRPMLSKAPAEICRQKARTGKGAVWGRVQNEICQLPDVINAAHHIISRLGWQVDARDVFTGLGSAQTW